ncbi:BlaI/MecI/CopY family transcriptional regulator [Hymenobacter ruricola]|uniref:BlaI/MecI/CopY family transcriptional regulator n=1 Tax=Hymenobacter ruricola TaxID=2791023 RepID=A0ABS0I477_9BACT|nr:BlaI/MecI/CopY family transcriptional regulator [Hymenobacter ruricola]MBF9221354.1 BlaI/MecI/CopY family transcriptional regulator [Hymenobacter ruricola]
MPDLPKPTDSELAILQVLWQHGPANVRLVNEQLSQQREVGYTTTLKWLQLMLDKGLVLRDESTWPHTYRPAVHEEETQTQLLDRLVQSAFGGSALKLVLRALGKGQNTREELDQIRALLNQTAPAPDATPNPSPDELAR